MVAKGNKDGHRWKMSGLNVQEQEKHGRETAYSRYNDGKPPKYYEGAPYPKDQTRTQDSQSRTAKAGAGDIPANSWLRGGGKGGEGYSSFNPSRTSRNPATEGSGGRKKSPGFK
jgi:hypothetical protein